MPQFIKRSSLLESLRCSPSPSHFVVHSPNADDLHSGYLVSLFLFHSLCYLFTVVFGFLTKDEYGLSVSRAEIPCARRRLGSY